MYLEDILTSAGLDIKSFDYTHPQYPICGILFFLTIVNVSKTKNRNASTIFQLFTIFHNICLCIFSTQCCIRLIKLAITIVVAEGFTGWSKFICTDYPLMYSFRSNASDDIGRYLHWFYLCKYYEMTDVFIAMQQGKTPSTLQIYYHIGIIFITWMNLIGHIPHFFVFILFSSIAQTVMYWYYATISFQSMRYVKKYKRFVAGIQIMCFVYGTLIGVVNTFMLFSCINNHSHCIYIITQIFIIGLFSMFMQYWNEKNQIRKRNVTNGKPKTHGKQRKKSKKTQ